MTAAIGIEPTTCSLGSCHSTTELLPRRAWNWWSTSRAPKGLAYGNGASCADAPLLDLLLGYGMTEPLFRRCLSLLQSSQIVNERQYPQLRLILGN